MPRVYRRRLIEQVQVEGADYIGSGKGYDFFRIRTWSAAQEFVANNDVLGGQAYTTNENTFNANINDSTRLYFFVEEDTNRIKYAVVKSSNATSDITIFSVNGQHSITTHANFLIEDENSSANAIRDIIPLYLIPDVHLDYVTQGFVYSRDNEVKAFLGHLTSATHLETLTINVNQVLDNAQEYGIIIEEIVFPEPEQSTERTLTPEEIDAIQTDIARAVDNLNNHTDNQTETEESETEIQQPEEVVYDFIYRVVGNEVHIVRAKKGVKELNIPEEINGKPVTTIESFAFYGNKDLERIGLPKSLKLIQKGAFVDCLPKLYRIAKSQIAANPKLVVSKDTFSRG